MKKQPWQKDNGEFECKTCKGMQAYIKFKTDKEVKVHKAHNYFVVEWWQHGQLHTHNIGGSFVYCLDEADFKPLFEAMGGSIEGEQTIVLKVRGKSPKMEKLIRYLIEEANHFPHPDYEEYSTEIHMLKDAEVVVQ